MNRRRLVPIALAPILAAAVLMAVPAGVQGATAITVNGTGAGRVFDGVGGLSGGGGTSRLLYDYPAAEQSQVLDYLFKPGYGASLQILKVEIGSDGNTTNGAEASHERTPTDRDYNRGYEWWLMEQAKARNPNLKLYGLEWGAPGWFNGGVGGAAGFYSQDNINYLIDWIRHAQSDHNLHIDYIGGWNEAGHISPYSQHHAWFVDLKNQMQGKGLTTKLVAFDADSGDLSVQNDLASDAALRSAVDIMGVHYPCPKNQGPADTCLSDPTAQSLGKPIWASEHGSQNYDRGAPALARALNRDYIDSRITALINWSAVSSWYPTLPFSGDGLMLADEPWSGSYQIGKSIWVMAHTAQFTQPGWQYLDQATGYLGDNRANGSFVTLRSPNRKDYSSIVETTRATSAQTATYTVSGGLSTGTVHVWATDLNSTNPVANFIHQGDLKPKGGSFTVTFQPGFVYTLTTTTGQSKGAAVSPGTAAMRLPYSDDFKSYPAGALPRYFATVQGAFETAPCGGGRTGNCMRQVIGQAPIAWRFASLTPPLVVMGDPGWKDYTVTTDALIEQAGSLDLVGRFQAAPQRKTGSQGYHLRVSSAGTWTLFEETGAGRDTTLASGSRTFGTNTWHRLSLSLHGRSIQASIDSTTVATVTDSTYTSGQPALVVSKWQTAQFDNFSVA